MYGIEHLRDAGLLLLNRIPGSQKLRRREREHLIKSMTGYGRARKTLHGRDITVEIRSVNNRYLDCSVRLPRAYLFAEDTLKGLVQKRTSRGKADVLITVTSLGAEETAVSVNEALAMSYIDALRRLQQLGNGVIKEKFCATDLARLPDVLTVTKGEEDLETVTADLCDVLEEALEAYTAMREVEGQKLAEDIRRRLDAIEALTQLVEARSPQTVAEYRGKLLSRMREALQSTTIDESRILTEAAIFADKVAVDVPVGRKLDFLIQELNREANTIGSKCSDLQIARDVVDLKAEIEKIREQVQNIE